MNDLDRLKKTSRTDRVGTQAPLSQTTMLDFGQFDFDQLAKIELAEVEIGRTRNWLKSNRWCLLCFFSLFFFGRRNGMISAQQNHTSNAGTTAASRCSCQNRLSRTTSWGEGTSPPAPPAPLTSSKESAKARPAAHERMFD